MARVSTPTTKIWLSSTRCDDFWKIAIIFHKKSVCTLYMCHSKA